VTQAARVPVTVLTGYLGAGKTTVLNQLIEQRRHERIAVIENEFGSVSVDGAVIGPGASGLWELSCGCLCCSGRSDLVEALRDAGSGVAGRIDRIVVETTGLADPGPVAQTVLADERISSKLYLDAVVTVVDAKHIVTQLEESPPPGFVNEAAAQVELADRLVVTKTDLVGEPELAAVLARIRGVNGWAEIVPATQGRVDSERVVGIGAFDLHRALTVDPLLLTREEHRHDPSVTAVGLEVAGEVDPDRVNRWLDRLLVEKGGDILRMKGVLAVAGWKRRYVFHGVRMLLDGGAGPPWHSGEPRTNRLVFIGRRLHRRQLENWFTECLVDGRHSAGCR
jgi:G3E family GTPase